MPIRDLEDLKNRLIPKLKGGLITLMFTDLVAKDGMKEYETLTLLSERENDIL